jgi:hypothetical protein
MVGAGKSDLRRAVDIIWSEAIPVTSVNPKVYIVDPSALLINPSPAARCLQAMLRVPTVHSIFPVAVLRVVPGIQFVDRIAAAVGQKKHQALDQYRRLGCRHPEQEKQKNQRY